MDFAPLYLVQRFFYRVADFFHHWYVDGSRAIAHKFMGTLEEIDQTLAIKVTLRYFFEPLYKDYTAIGRMLGVIFRSARIAIAGAVYLLIAAFFALLYLAWIAFPIAILFYAAKSI